MMTFSKLTIVTQHVLLFWTLKNRLMNRRAARCRLVTFSHFKPLNTKIMEQQRARRIARRTISEKVIFGFGVTRAALAILLLSGTLCQATIVGSFNIRYDNPKDASNGDGWQERAPVIASLIRFHRFDVLGIQEAYAHQVDKLQSLLPAYAHTGCGRDDGKSAGEFAAIFYRKERYALKNSGTFWLSQTPEMPSVGWDAKLMRICTWVELEDIKNQETLFVFNTHFDHQGTVARLESARLILKSIRAIAADQPLVLVGDFNVDQNSEGYKIIQEATFLDDAFETAEEKYDLNGTMNGFKVNAYTDRRIDHIFHSPAFKVLRYGVLTDSYRAPSKQVEASESSSTAFPKELKFKNYEARLPSDHFPILVELESPR